MIRAAVFLAVGLFAFAIQAEVIELEGTIKSLDADKREITIGKKTLDVAKKCQITIDGAESKLADLQPNQKVVVEYDDELEVAKSIAVGDTGVGSAAMARDLKSLQGEWVATTLVISGKKLTKSEKQRHFRRFVIKGNSYTEEIVRNGEAFTVSGKFELDPRTKAFDFIGRGQFAGKDPNPGAIEMLGFYEIEGEAVKLVIRKKEKPDTSRPKAFGEGDEDKAWTNSFILEKDE